jgi:hypothetical protein
MSVAASDLIWYGSANMPEADSGTAGGAIDETVRVVPDSATLFNTLNDTVEVVSDNAGDTTQDITITGRDSEGSIITDVLSLDGTNVVAGVETFERIDKIELDGVCAGTVTVRKATGDTLIVNIEAGVVTIRRPHVNIAADASGGSTRIFYEKIFLQNNHATLALLGATISESSDAEAQTEFAIEDAQNDTGTSTNRVTAPTGITGDGFSSTAKTIPGADLGPGDHIGVWLKTTLPAGDPATKTTSGIQAAGTSI